MARFGWVTGGLQSEGGGRGVAWPDVRPAIASPRPRRRRCGEKSRRGSSATNVRTSPLPSEGLARRSFVPGRASCRFPPLSSRPRAPSTARAIASHPSRRPEEPPPRPNGRAAQLDLAGNRGRVVPLVFRARSEARLQRRSRPRGSQRTPARSSPATHPPPRSSSRPAPRRTSPRSAPRSSPAGSSASRNLPATSAALRRRHRRGSEPGARSPCPRAPSRPPGGTRGCRSVPRPRAPARAGRPRRRRRRPPRSGRRRRSRRSPGTGAVGPAGPPESVGPSSSRPTRAPRRPARRRRKGGRQRQFARQNAITGRRRAPSRRYDDPLRREPTAFRRGSSVGRAHD